jgi:hypothetical protein
VLVTKQGSADFTTLLSRHVRGRLKMKRGVLNSSPPGGPNGIRTRVYKSATRLLFGIIRLGNVDSTNCTGEFEFWRRFDSLSSSSGVQGAPSQPGTFGYEPRAAYEAGREGIEGSLFAGTSERVVNASTLFAHTQCTWAAGEVAQVEEVVMLVFVVPNGKSSGGRTFGFSLASLGRLRSTFASLATFAGT